MIALWLPKSVTVEKYFLLFQIIFLFYNANPRVDWWNSSTHTSDPAKVPNLLISRVFLPSTQDVNLQVNIFRWLCRTHCQCPCHKASSTRLYQHDQFYMPPSRGSSVDVSWSGSIGVYSMGSIASAIVLCLPSISEVVYLSRLTE